MSAYSKPGVIVDLTDPNAKPIDLEVCAIAAYEHYYDDPWSRLPERERQTWREIAVLVLRAAGHGDIK